MRTRKQISDSIYKPEKNIGLYERQLQIEAVILELLLDIRDLLKEHNNEPGKEDHNDK